MTMHYITKEQVFEVKNRLLKGQPVKAVAIDMGLSRDAVYRVKRNETGGKTKDTILKNVKLVWATRDGDSIIGYQARVSAPANQDNLSTMPKLIKWMAAEGHVSPFEMANMCVEINTHRDIARQILRHRSFSFQEFSQRYADVSALDDLGGRECRMQDTKNRQNSLPTDDPVLEQWWEQATKDVNDAAKMRYDMALEKGIAKEVARTLLPEGLTPSRMYVNGTVRSWVFYLKQRLHPSTQKEHREIAEQIRQMFKAQFPDTAEAFDL